MSYLEIEMSAYYFIIFFFVSAQFLKTLVSISRAKRVLELGLFTGCASLAIAEALPNDGIVYSCEVEPYIVDFARSLLDKSKHGRKVKIMKGMLSPS